MKKIIMIILIIIALVVGAYFLFIKNASNGEIVFQYISLEKGDIEVLVSCTGTLEVTGAVEVGTELSGTLTEVYVDFNDNVVKDQVMAVLDTTKLVYEVRNAEASYANVEAQYNLAKREYEDDKKMYEKGFISDIDLLQSETSFKQAQASYVSAQITLEKAQTNLEKYSIIHSPITGIVIDRAVEEGQTVNASSATPVLFTVAENLSEMEIEALVDESDIGLIEEGQKARFTVAAYTDDEFEGVVKQIRLEPQVVSNVVNYTVIISASNDESKLLPGMTATIDIIVQSAEDAYYLPSTALSYTPPESVLKSMMSKMKAQGPPQRGGESDTQRPQQPEGMEPPSGDFMKNMAMVWYEDGDGTIKMSPVKTGFSDDINTEITNIGKLTTKSKIIIGDSAGSSSSSTSPSSSSSSRNQRRGPGGPPMGGLF